MRNPVFTRQLIVEKATSLFNTQGYRATSISDITRATGITKGAIYGNFKNKDEVAEASFEYAVEVVMQDLRERIKLAPTAPLKLKTILSYYQEYIKNPPIKGGCPIINTSIEADDNYPQLRSRAVRSVAILKDSIRRIIQRGVSEDQLKKETPVEQFGLLLYASIQGAVMLSRVEGDLDSYKSVQAYLIRAIDSYTS